jgi:hypothetical protein
MEQEYQHVLYLDSKGNPLEGHKSYMFHLPPGIPASDFWSVLVYDKKTGLIIRNGQQWPSVHRNSSKLEINPDGSIDIWFGPESHGRNNWVRTLPGKNWYMILRLYYPLASLLDKTWQPGEIEEINY